MDNKHDNGLSPENQKWLDALLNSPESSREVSSSELAKQFASANVPEEIPEIIPEPISEPIPEPEPQPVPKPQDLSDEALEKILAEHWFKEEAQATQMQEAPAAPQPPQENAPVEKKGRPKKKDEYGLLGIPHIISTLIWLVLVVAIGVSLGRVLWVCCADVMAFGKESQKITITITEDDTIKTISKKLGNANLVRYPNLFEFFAKVTGKDKDIDVGTYTLNSHLDYNAMINAMVNYSSNREVVDIMFPEGINCAQMFKLLEEKNVCSVADLEEYAANGELKNYWFLEGVARGDKYCLEGYLAPDTYSFYTDDEPRRVLEKFLNEFEDRFTDLMKEDFQLIQKAYANRLRANGFSAAFIQENTLTLHQVVTLASVVQRETSSDAECYDIASVFYNRLVNPSIQSLGADATVYYAVGDYFSEIEELTAEHLSFDSPYNTRLNKGIPPGPICNMGVQALYAALEPNETNYKYFVYDKEKFAHRFAVTESEHNKNVAELMGE